jgi:hypothetical protein
MNVLANFMKNVNELLMLKSNGCYTDESLFIESIFFSTFWKASTDPGRFHTRAYNAEAESRKRKKYHRELPQIEQEFLNILSEYNDLSFLYPYSQINL